MLGDMRHRFLLPDKTIGIFVETTLPGVVWGGKEEVSTTSFSNFLRANNARQSDGFSVLFFGLTLRDRKTIHYKAAAACGVKSLGPFRA